MASDSRERVAVQQELWRDQQPVEVRIEAGEVTLAGEVRRRDQAVLLPKNNPQRDAAAVYVCGGWPSRRR